MFHLEKMDEKSMFKISEIWSRTLNYSSKETIDSFCGQPFPKRDAGYSIHNTFEILGENHFSYRNIRELFTELDKTFGFTTRNL